MVKVYSISVTNVVDGLASACRACALVPQNSQQAGSSCVPCPAGFFIDRDTNRCQECPPNTHLAGRHTYGQDACVACGPGSISSKVESPLLGLDWVSFDVFWCCHWYDTINGGRNCFHQFLIIDTFDGHYPLNSTYIIATCQRKKLNTTHLYFRAFCDENIKFFRNNYLVFMVTGFD